MSNREDFKPIRDGAEDCAVIPDAQAEKPLPLAIVSRIRKAAVRSIARSWALASGVNEKRTG
jgi:hypothetical protein